MFISTGPDGPAIHPNPHFPVNKGGLCVKGWSAAATLSHPDRLLTPLVRNAAGVLTPASWDEATGAIAAAFRSAQSRYGADAVGVFGGGSLTNEKAYLLGKFARVALRTANIDYNGRFCMSSAAAAALRAFGADRGLPFPLDDIAAAAVVLLVGGNPAETMPPVMQYFDAQQRRGGTLIVVDPRRTATAAWGRHLAIRPGTDAALANGLLHILIRDRLIDRAYIDSRTEGFEAAQRTAIGAYWPQRVEQLTGIPERALVETAHLLGTAPSAMVLTARGPEQHAQGVNNSLAYINLALAIGAVGKPHSGFGSLTGQGNGQGGREHGQKADQLPGYRRLDDPAARREVAAVWNVAEATLPRPGKSAFEMIEALGSDIRALLVMGSNIAVSAPDAMRVRDRLSALDALVVVDFFRSETAEHAHVVLPAAQWAEEEGTVTNLEGRVLFRARAVAPPAGVRTDVEILTGLAEALGRGEHFRYRGSADVFAELRRATAGAPADYSGITYEALQAGEAIHWPCSTVGGGTPRLFADRFWTANGRARFHATPHQEIADARDDAFPLILTTGRVLAHYQSGTQTRRIASLVASAPEGLAELHPAAARRAGIGDGDPIRLTTRRGAATFRAKVKPAIRPDTVFAPFHWSGAQSANRLTNPALDPTSRMPEFKACAVRIERAAPEEPPG
jgi:assimilatory nitrate reductase catalytic subunit